MKNFWCEVYLDKIEHNINLVKELTENRKVIAVIKGNGYGLGIEEVSKYLDDKVDMFAVADVDEARRVKSDKPILLLPPLVTYEDFNLDIPNLIYTLDNEEILDHINKEKEIKIHIYIDTGMNRMGIKPNRLENIISRIKNEFSNITIDGLYTHLHNTKNKKYTLRQIELFKNTIEKYKDDVTYVHCLNSSGALCRLYRGCCEFTNAIKIGNLLYGYEGEAQGFKKAYCFIAKPVNKYWVKKGEDIGYGCTYKAKRDMYIGILGLGNIEHFGFNRDVKKNILYSILRVVYNHIKVKSLIFNEEIGINILGKPNMNSTIIDLTHCSSDSLLKVTISPVLADSSIKKVYKHGSVW